MWEKFPIDFSHVYEREGATHVSTLDHFFLSEQLLDNVSDTGVIHHPDNSSDHEPIYCVLNSITVIQSCKQHAARKPRPCWRKASSNKKQKFEYLLDSRLDTITTPSEVTECRDLHCKNVIHLEAIDWHTAEVLEAVQAAAEAALSFPKAGSMAKSKKVTPGYNTHMKPFKETAYFWNAVWRSAGRALNTHLHTIMKKS